MSVAPTEKSDLAAIRAVVAAAIRHSVAQSEEDALFLIDDLEEALTGWASDPAEKLLLKYETNGELVGVILVKNYWNLSVLFVHPRHQRLGVGRALVCAVLSECRAKSPKAKLMVNSSSVGVPFYRALGFRQTGPGIERPGGCIPLEYDFT
jgi:GNAT superfamily N-acetyltransferase